MRRDCKLSSEWREKCTQACVGGVGCRVQKLCAATEGKLAPRRLICLRLTSDSETESDGASSVTPVPLCDTLPQEILRRD